MQSCLIIAVIVFYIIQNIGHVSDFLTVNVIQKDANDYV